MHAACRNWRYSRSFLRGIIFSIYSYLLFQCVLSDSTAAEKRFTAKSTGCILQGAAGTTGGKGKRVYTFPRPACKTLSCKIQVKIVIKR